MRMGALVRGKLRDADQKEQRMNGGKYKAEFSKAWGGFGEIQAPAFCRSPGIKLKAGGRGEKSLQLTE